MLLYGNCDKFAICGFSGKINKYSNSNNLGLSLLDGLYHI